MKGCLIHIFCCSHLFIKAVKICLGQFFIIFSSSISIHVDDLNNLSYLHAIIASRMWKREIQNTKSSHRPTAYIMSAAPYSPPRRVSPHRSEPNETKRQALRMMMGIGGVLNTARLKLATEEGELDVDEDEYGLL